MDWLKIMHPKLKLKLKQKLKLKSKSNLKSKPKLNPEDEPAAEAMSGDDYEVAGDEDCNEIGYESEN